MIEALGEDGYKVFQGVVPIELCETVAAEIKTHCFGAEELSQIGTLEMYHYQGMWEIRQHQAVYETFATVLDCRELWVSIDRCCYKPPGTGVSFIHWDENPNESPRPTKVQGLVALTDTTEEMGGFQCLPDLYKGLDDWLNSMPTGKALSPGFEVAYEQFATPTTWRSWGIGNCRHGGWPVRKVAMRAGDLLIWDSYLPHGNGVNRGLAPRLCQYLTMFQAEGWTRLSAERTRCWLHNLPPSGWAFPGDRRLIEQSRDKPAALSLLGARLLGSAEWPERIFK